MPLTADLPRHFNTTNVRTHGLHVSPDGIADNIFRSMEPGQSYDIEIAIPEDHTRGTYWYHPNHHGSADVQITSGMTGALIVEGDFAAVPEMAAARERVLIVSEVRHPRHGRGVDRGEPLPRPVWQDTVIVPAKGASRSARASSTLPARRCCTAT